MREWRRQSHVKWYCRYHVVIVPKYRQKAIFGRLRKDIGRILRELCEQFDIELIEYDLTGSQAHARMLTKVGILSSEEGEQIVQGLETIRQEYRQGEFNPGVADDKLVYTFDAQSDATGIAGLLRELNHAGIDFRDLHTSESSLEDIFVSLVHENRNKA